MSQPITRRRFLVAGASVLAVGAAALVGGTYAKYKAFDHGEDSATVAKFGVQIDVSGSLFSTTYVQQSSGNYAAGAGSTIATVVAESGQDVVAPGTKSPATNQLTFAFSGSPEVSVKLEGLVGKDLSSVTTTTYSGRSSLVPTEVYLAKGVEYSVGDLPGGNPLTLTTDYYPVKYTLTRTYCPYNATNGSYSDEKTETVVSGDRATVVKTYIEDGLPTELGTIAPNTDLSKAIGKFVLTWEWSFTTSSGYLPMASGSTEDLADTVLGWLAANPNQTTISSENYCLASSMAIAFAVIQVD
jgi:hypothetical protein